MVSLLWPGSHVVLCEMKEGEREGCNQFDSLLLAGLAWTALH